MKALSILLLALSISLFSCQADTEGILPPTETNDSIYLKELITLDATQASGLDTSSKAEFKYDALKRISLALFTSYEPGIAGSANNWHEYQWLYQGTDTLPGRIVHLWGDYQ